MVIQNNKIITDAISWYAEKKPLYEQLSKKVESIISEIIFDENIPTHAIYSRAKDIESFSKKIEDLKYTDPITQITDFSGIRIIAYVESDLDKISKVIKDYFEVDPKNSIDKSKSLGTDKVGYRSIHFIAKLPLDRIKLPEYKKFKDLSFEIQIRTILQHSWAEIEHDKNYKFSGELPENLKRRFKVLAGVLELADREFNSIAYEIDQYSISVNVQTKKGQLDIRINSTSLKSYLAIKFSDLIEEGLSKSLASSEKTVISELRELGIESLKDLDNSIPEKYNEKAIELKDTDDNNFLGLLRNIMLIKDAENYLEKSWQNRWTAIPKSSYSVIKEFNPKIEELIKQFNIDINMY